jgi:hypothetical protein
MLGMSKADELDELAFSFFKLFAQYEYALKAMGYGSAGPRGQAEPDWDRFANEVGALVMEGEAQGLAAAREYILQHPPKRQVWKAGIVEWEPVPNNERSPQILFAHIRRVRNNLYHGGKFNGRWIDPDRSAALLTNALVVLGALTKLSQPLGEAVKGIHF